MAPALNYDAAYCHLPCLLSPIQSSTLHMQPSVPTAIPLPHLTNPSPLFQVSTLPATTVMEIPHQASNRACHVGQPSAMPVTTVIDSSLWQSSAVSVGRDPPADRLPSMQHLPSLCRVCSVCHPSPVTGTPAIPLLSLPRPSPAVASDLRPGGPSVHQERRRPPRAASRSDPPTAARRQVKTARASSLTHRRNGGPRDAPRRPQARLATAGRLRLGDRRTG